MKILGSDMEESELKEIADSLTGVLQKHVNLNSNSTAQRMLFDEASLGRKLDLAGLAGRTKVI